MLRLLTILVVVSNCCWAKEFPLEIMNSANSSEDSVLQPVQDEPNSQSIGLNVDPAIVEFYDLGYPPQYKLNFSTNQCTYKWRKGWPENTSRVAIVGSKEVDLPSQKFT